MSSRQLKQSTMQDARLHRSESDSSMFSSASSQKSSTTAQRGKSRKGRSRKRGNGGGYESQDNSSKRYNVSPKQSQEKSTDRVGSHSPHNARGEQVTGLAQLSMFKK